MVRFKLGLKGLGYLVALFLVDSLLQMLWVLFSGKHVSIMTGVLTSVGMIVIGGLLIVPLYKSLAKRNESFKLTHYRKEDLFFATKWIIFMYLFIMASNVIYVMCFKHAPEATNQSTLEGFSKIHSMMPGLLVLTMLIGPILEEMMFRGVIFNYFVQNLNPKLQIGIAGISFGIFHVLGSSFQLNALIQYSIMGCVFAYVYYKTQRLQMSMLIHFINNGIASVVLIIQLFI